MKMKRKLRPVNVPFEVVLARAAKDQARCLSSKPCALLRYWSALKACNA